MKTLVIQSYRTENVPDWIARCMASVRSWAAEQGFDYQFADDSSFALCGEEYLARVGRNMRSITNLTRLELIKAAHGRGYDRAIWLDADVLVFRPDLFEIDVVERYAFARETWIEVRGTEWHATQGVNNCAFVCMRGEPDLDFLIAAVRHIALHRRIASNYQVGGDLIKGLRSSLDYATHDGVGMFSKHVVKAIGEGHDKVVAMQAIEFGVPVFAANLCGAEHYRGGVSEALTGRALDRLVSSRGDAVNNWLLQSPNNLRDGKPHVAMSRLFTPEQNVALQFRQVHGREPDLVNPRTFNERITAKKLALTDPVFRITADKFAVRDYVAERIGRDALIPLLQTCETADDIDLDALPSAFIIKPTHGSGWYEIVRDKKEIVIDDLRSRLRTWLRTDFSTVHLEGHYKDIPRRLLVEQLLLTNTETIPEDYKFVVFRGRVGMIQVELDRLTNHKRSLFDRSWRRLAVEFAYPPGGHVPRPEQLDDMIAIAERLAEGFDMVRVDLYVIGGKIYFGELTHTPNAGIGRFKPPEFDAVLGRIWETGEAIPERYFVDAPEPARAPTARTDFAARPTPGAESRRRPTQSPASPAPFASPKADLNAKLLQFNALSNFVLDVTVGVGETPKAGGAEQIRIELGAAPNTQEGPTVSCLMCTRDRFRQAQLAIKAYRRQTWRARELVVVDSGVEGDLRRWVESLSDPTIRIVSVPGATDSLGAMRNRSVDEARGSHIAQWDDDDLSHPARLEAQVAVLKHMGAQANLLSRELMWMPGQSQAAILQSRPHENTLLCEKSAIPRYPDLPKKEDTPVVRELIRTRVVSFLDLPELYVYVVHGANTFDSDHMRAMWDRATQRFTAQAYSSALSQLSRCFPINEYRQILNGST